MSILEAFFIAVLILATGAIAIYIIIRPSLGNGLNHGELIIPLEEIAPIWTRHNKEFVRPEPSAGGTDSGQDALDALWGKSPSPDNTAVGQNGTVQMPAAPVANVAIPPAAAASSAPHIGVPAPPATPVSPAPAAPIAPPAQAPGGDLSLSSLAQPLKSLWDDCIGPYREVIKMQKAEGVISELIRLLEKHGHCPSVVIDGDDAESTDLESVRSNLVNTSLRDHSYAVCRNLVKIVKDNIYDPDIRMPSAIIMSLGHDIGKIPEFRESRVFNSKDHAFVGSAKLAEIMVTINEHWVGKVVSSVKEHHLPVKDDMTNMLKQADRLARQNELMTYTQSYVIRPFKEWFDVKTFVTRYIAPGVNACGRNGRWDAFSFHGTIYVIPDWIWEQSKRMCHDFKILDMDFVYVSEKESSIRRIVSAFREKDMTPLLGDNCYGRKFDVRTSVQTKKFTTYYLVPFTIPDYLVEADLERRKDSILSLINAVKPL